MADLDDFMMADEVPGEAPRMPEPPPLPARPPSLFEIDTELPASIDAEKTILGAILLDNAAHSEAAEVLEADDFSLDSHRRIFLRMTELMDEQRAVDIVTLANELSRHNEIESVGGVAYLASLTEGLPMRPVIADYIRIVKDKSLLRKLMLICSAAIQRAADRSSTALSVFADVEGQMLEVAQKAVSGNLRSVANSVEIAGGFDPYLKPIINAEVQQGMPTGFVDVDRVTGGLRRGELIIIAARPSMGKTAMGINIAANCALDQGAVVAFFSLEMTRQALEKRLLASNGRVNVRRAMSGEFLSTMEKEKLSEALVRLVESELYIDDTPAMTPTQIRAKARRLKQKCGRLDLLVVDYLQLVTAGHRTENRRIEVEICSRAMKAMAKELDVPVVALAQVGRSSEQRTDKRPVLADLREAGGIEQDADIVQFIHRDSYYNRDEEMSEAERAMTEIIIAKNREGPTTIERILYIAPFTCFMNLARGE